jgi:hypothetical protein
MTQYAFWSKDLFILLLHFNQFPNEKLEKLSRYNNWKLDVIYLLFRRIQLSRYFLGGVTDNPFKWKMIEQNLAEICDKVKNSLERRLIQLLYPASQLS